MAKTHPSYVIDTTFSSKNISSAASVYQFTAAASAKVQFVVKLTNAAGNGDYVVYLSHQWLGSGSAAVVLPKTTATAASGETVLEFITTEVNVKATDVVDIMIKGLVGDTSVNGAVRIIADNPSVFEATDAVTLGAGSITSSVIADGAVTADKIASNAITASKIASGAIDADALATDAVTEIADGVWDETLSGHVAAGSAGKALGDAAAGSTLTAADVWSYTARTLTQSAAQVQSVMEGSTILFVRGDSFSLSLTGLGALTGYEAIDFCVKDSKDDADAEAIIWIRKVAGTGDDGLLVLNG